MHQASYLPIPDATYVLAEYFLRYYIDIDITYFLPRCYAVLRTHDTRTHRFLSLSLYIAIICTTMGYPTCCLQSTYIATS